MESLYYVYREAMRYLIYIFSVGIFLLGLLLICSFIIDKDHKIKEKYKDEIRNIKNDNIKSLKKNRLKEAK